MKSLLIAINMRLCFQLELFSQVQSDRNWEGVWSKKPTTFFAPCKKPFHNLMGDREDITNQDSLLFHANQQLSSTQDMHLGSYVLITQLLYSEGTVFLD